MEAMKPDISKEHLKEPFSVACRNQTQVSYKGKHFPTVFVSSDAACWISSPTSLKAYFNFQDDLEDLT